MTRMHNPPHPGEVLRAYLGSATVTRAAAAMKVDRVTLSRVLNGGAGISPDMAYRIGAVTKTSPEMWAGMQMQYDLWQAGLAKRPTLTPLLTKFEPAVHGSDVTGSITVPRREA